MDGPLRARCPLVASMALLCAACGLTSSGGGGGSAGGSTGDPTQVVEALRACGIYGEGEINQVRDTPLTALSDCAARCLAEADCDELTAFVCNYETMGALDECKTACALEGSVRCPSGAVVASSAVCNGVDDCVGGEDEMDCPEPVSDCQADWYGKCDGNQDCDDGSDEAECEYTRCDGEIVAPAYFCDGWEWCQDGLDERGCAEQTCGDF